MPRPAHNLLTFAGQFRDGQVAVEEWSFSLRGPSLPLPTEQSGRDALAAAYKAVWVGNMAQIHPPSVVLSQVKYARVGADGKYEKNAQGTFVQGVWQGTEPGLSVGGTRYPLQTSIVATLLSERSGPTGKGRIFLPQDPGNLGSDFLLSSGQTQAIATQVAEFLRDLAAGDFIAQVVSTKGYMSPVSKVGVGRRLDVIRSRGGRQLDTRFTIDL